MESHIHTRLLGNSKRLGLFTDTTSSAAISSYLSSLTKHKKQVLEKHLFVFNRVENTGARTINIIICENHFLAVPCVSKGAFGHLVCDVDDGNSFVAI